MNSSGNNSLNNKSDKGLLGVAFPPHRLLARAIAAVCGATVATMSSLAFGLGLGEFSSTSFLGQPLKASIELVSLEGDIDPDSLIVRQVTADEATRMGVDIFNVPYRIDFVVDAKGGAPHVTVTSREPINEPYLSLMVELRWPKGVVYREYPLLLDPPPVVPAREMQREPRQVPVQPVSSSSPAPVVPSSTRPVPVQMRLEPLTTEQGKYKVQPGDTLSKIAARWREGTSQSIGETAQWLFDNNTHAFASNDINRLRAGAVLQMPDLSTYRLAEGVSSAPPSLASLPKSGSGEGTSGAEATSEEAAGRSGGGDAAQARDMRGLLTLGTENRDDKTRELIDMLVRENETLKARMEKLESSEYLDTLKQLIVLQRQQISDLREKLGIPDNDVTQEMDTLLGEIGVQVEQTKRADVSLSTPTSALTPVESSLPEAVLDVEPAVAPPVTEKETKSWLVWLLFGAGVALTALFVGMFAYYRRMVPAKHREERSFAVAAQDQYQARAEPTLDTFRPVLQEKPVSIDFDGELTPIYVHKKKNEENWLGEKVSSADVEANAVDDTTREVQEAFEDLVLDEDILRDLNDIEEQSLEGLTETIPQESVPEKIESITSAQPDSKAAKKDKKGKKGNPNRRPDEEVRMSIAEKMAQYNPDEYRQEIESLGLLELDELAEVNESDEDDVETLVYRAMMFCEFKKFDKARELIQGKLEVMDDARLAAALEQVDALQRDAQSSSKKAI